jgi:hypothetical protein
VRKLSGAISDKIRAMLKSGDLPSTAINPPRAAADPPKTSSIRHGEGHGLGKGATRRRSGPGAKTGEPGPAWQ